MNDPVVKNFGRLVGRRMLLIPIMMIIGFVLMLLLGGILALIGTFAGGAEAIILILLCLFCFCSSLPLLADCFSLPYRNASQSWDNLTPGSPGLVKVVDT